MNNTRIRLGQAAVATALAVTATLASVAFSTPALANDGNCGPADFCLYEGTNLTGGRWDNYGNVDSYASGHRWWGTTISLNDSASSTRNRNSLAVGLYRHAHGRGDAVVVGGSFQINNLADYEMDNQASSNIYWFN